MLGALQLRLPEGELLLQPRGLRAVVEAVVDDDLLEVLQVSADLGHEEVAHLLLRRLQPERVGDAHGDGPGWLLRLVCVLETIVRFHARSIKNDSKGKNSRFLIN